MKHAYQRWLIRASISNIILGVLLGIYLYLSPLLEKRQLLLGLYNVRTVHVHLILLGGVIQMIMGVALWMFPRMKKPPHYTSHRQGMLLFGLFNSGILLRSIGELAGKLEFWYLIAIAGVFLQVLAFFFFAYLIHSRIRRP